MLTHVFSDMDGTLLDDTGALRASNVALIKSAQLPFTLVSARSPQEMADAITTLDLTTPQIAFNGGLIFTPTPSGPEPLHALPLSEASTARVLATIAEQFPNVSLSFYDQSEWFTHRIDRGIEHEAGMTTRMPAVVANLEHEAAARTVFKVMAITFDLAEMAALTAAVEGLGLADISIQRTDVEYLEITHQEAHKANGIRWVLAQEGADPSTAAAFGDGHNDLTMLQLVGTPIVMANADPAIKAHARHITASNNDDGVGVGLHRFLLD